MRGDARRLVEEFPALEIRLDDVGQFSEDPLDADVMHEPHHVFDADERDEGFFRRGWRCHDPPVKTKVAELYRACWFDEMPIICQFV